jgi:hypothetical protein
MNMEQTVCSEMLAYKIQTPGNYLEVSTRSHSSVYMSVELNTGLFKMTVGF